MTTPSSGNGNGYPRWRDIDQLRREYEREHEKLEANVTLRFDRAHQFYSGAHEDLTKRVEKIDERVDSLESVIDQQRGARALVYALIGTNLLSAIALFGTIYVIVTHQSV